MAKKKLSVSLSERAISKLRVIAFLTGGNPYCLSETIESLVNSTMEMWEETTGNTLDDYLMRLRVIEEESRAGTQASIETNKVSCEKIPSVFLSERDKFLAKADGTRLASEKRKAMLENIFERTNLEVVTKNGQKLNIDLSELDE